MHGMNSTTHVLCRTCRHLTSTPRGALVGGIRELSRLDRLSTDPALNPHTHVLSHIRYSLAYISRDRSSFTLLRQRKRFCKHNKYYEIIYIIILARFYTLPQRCKEARYLILISALERLSLERSTF